MLCYYGDDVEEYRRWENKIKMDLLKNSSLYGNLELAQDLTKAVNVVLKPKGREATELVIPVISELWYFILEKI